MKLPEIHRIQPTKRLQLANHLFWWSIVLIPLALVATWYLPKVGVMILQLVSFLAITFTAYDILSTADVRAEQDSHA